MTKLGVRTSFRYDDYIKNKEYYRSIAIHTSITSIFETVGEGLSEFQKTMVSKDNAVVKEEATTKCKRKSINYFEPLEGSYEVDVMMELTVIFDLSEHDIKII